MSAFLLVNQATGRDRVSIMDNFRWHSHQEVVGENLFLVGRVNGQ